MLLSVSDLQKSFAAPDGERTLIVDVPSFSLDAGEQVAVRGASGSGKTTFLNLIAGILQADRGRIVLDGNEMTAMSEGGRDRVRAKTIGYVFQNFNLLQGYTALENVMLGMLFGPGVDARHARGLLERVGLSHRVDYRPAQLSIGQQQRVAVARALANRPKLVLADEPTGNLDSASGEAVMDMLDELHASGCTVCLASHDPRYVARAKRHVRLLDGRVVAGQT